MASDLFKRQVQIAIQSSITKDNYGDLEPEFVDWFNKSRKHTLIARGSKYHPIVAAAALTNHVSRWVEYVPVYDPIMLLERFRDIDPTISKIVYIYDLKLLGKLLEYDALRFFSYVKYLLMNNVRCVFSVDCKFARSDLDLYFKNKKVSDLVYGTFGNSKYCKLLEV